MYDLHTHSHCSDGYLSPQDLVALAKQQGVRVLALTDHDTLEGIAAAQEAARSSSAVPSSDESEPLSLERHPEPTPESLKTESQADDSLTIITGIELSTQWNGRGVHIVGLDIDVDSPVLQAAIAQQTQARIDRAETIAQRLEKAGIKGALAGAQHYANGGSIGRPHFAQYMIDKGYVSTFPQAFKRYLGAGKVGDVKQCWPDMDVIVGWILQAGGIPVLAHPDKYDLTRTKLYQLLQDFVDAGGLAMEVVSGHQDPSVTDKLARAAADFSLLASCGSDFHSPKNSWQSLGGYSPLPESCEPVWTRFN
jgi:predicted metal-dependent phosphoesterase TrpH